MTEVPQDEFIFEFFEMPDEEFINSARKLFEINEFLTILFTFHACLYQLSFLATGPHHGDTEGLITGNRLN